MNSNNKKTSGLLSHQSQPKVSIIIPVYKVEKYIEKCVRTLFGQTLDNIEYIFVDDYSPDNSIAVMQKVLEEFPERKSQVKIIQHKINKGVSQSRQDGVDAAEGEYIIHCDPDDWVELDMYEVLYNKAKETDSDLVICDFSNVIGNKTIINSQKPKELSSIAILEGIAGRIPNTNIHGATWNKLLKAEIYKNARFPDNVSYCEDVHLWFQILRKDLNIEYVHQPLYFYRDNSSSLINTISKDAQAKDLNLIKGIYNLSKSTSDQRYATASYSFIISVIYSRFFRAGNLNNLKFKSNFKDFRKYIFLNKKLSLPKKMLLDLSMLGFFEEITKIIRYIRKIRQ